MRHILILMLMAASTAAMAQKGEEPDEMDIISRMEGKLEGTDLTWKSWCDVDGNIEVTLFQDGYQMQVLHGTHSGGDPVTLSGVGTPSLEDVNFDGYDDLLVYAGTRGVRYFEFYECYLYDPSTGTYRHSEAFADVPCPVVDKENKIIWSCGGSSYVSAEHGIFEWIDGELRQSDSVEERYEEHNGKGRVAYYDLAGRPLKKMSALWRKHLQEDKRF